MIQVLVHNQVEPVQLEQLKAIPGVEVEVVPYTEGEFTLPEELLQNKTILFSSHLPSNHQAMQSLEWVQISSVGYNQLLDQGLNERGIRATNAQGIFDVPIAEWNVTMMIQLARDMRGMFRNQEQGVWDRSARFQTEIRGTRVGIWGYGGIGRETARLLKTMGIHVSVLVRDGIKERKEVYRVEGTGDPQGLLPDQVFTYGQEEAFLNGLDFLIIAVPLTKHTKGLIGEKQLRSLPNHAYLLNPARGPIVQEQALLKALEVGWIAGAALDTHYYYPMPVDHPLWKFPNVIMTPHISGSSQSTHFLQRVWGIFAENDRRYAAGQPLLNELTKSQLEGN